MCLRLPVRRKGWVVTFAAVFSIDGARLWVEVENRYVTAHAGGNLSHWTHWTSAEARSNRPARQALLRPSLCDGGAYSGNCEHVSNNPRPAPMLGDNSRYG
jgi:hypothetical protein